MKQVIDIDKQEYNKEKSLDEEMLKKNYDQLSSFRFYTTVFLGVLAGILNLTGVSGFAFYFIGFLIIGIMLYVIKFNSLSKGTFFFSNSSVIYYSIGGNAMIFLIFWVMFYNFVHIY